MKRRPPISTLFPNPTLFRSPPVPERSVEHEELPEAVCLRALDEVEVELDEPVETVGAEEVDDARVVFGDRKSTRLNSSHANISYAVFCLKKKTTTGSNDTST